MKRRSFLAKAAAGGLGVGAAAGLSAPLYAQGKRTLTLVTSWTRGLPGVHDGAQHVADSIQEMSEGQLTVDLKAAGEMVEAFEVFDAVTSGQADMYHSTENYHLDRHPAFAFFASIPFGMTAQEMYNWYSHDGGRELYEELSASFGLIGFPAGNSGPQPGGWFRREIGGPEDFFGLKFRMAGLGGRALGKLGATLINLPGGEVYQALASGALDGAEWNGPWSDEKVGFQEVTHIYYLGGFHEPEGSNSLVVNLDVYNDLTPAQRRIIEVASGETYIWNLSQFLTNNGRALIRLRELGIRVHQFPDSVWNAFGAASEEVHRDNLKDEFYRKVYDNYFDSLKSSSRWLAQSESVFRSQRDRVLQG